MAYPLYIFKHNAKESRGTTQFRNWVDLYRQNFIVYLELTWKGFTAMTISPTLVYGFFCR